MSNIPQNFTWNTTQTGPAKFDGALPNFRITDGNGLLVTVSGGRIEALNNDQGWRVVYDFRGEEGEDTGKVVAVGFNIGHRDIQKAQKSGQFFNGFLACVGHVGPMQNPGQVNNRKLRVTVVSANNTEYPDNTNVSGYRKADGTVPGQGPLNAGGGQGNNQSGGFGGGQQTQQNNGNQGGQQADPNAGWGNNVGNAQNNQGHNNNGGNVQQQDPNAGQNNNGGQGFQQGNFNNPNGGNNNGGQNGGNAPWQ